jgi:serralysin
MTTSDPFADIPVRLCVDQFLPDHLHEAAGREAVRECPRQAVLLRPEDVVSDRDLRSVDQPERLVYQRLGLLRKAKWEPGRTIAIGFHPDAPQGVPSRIMAILEESSQVLNLAWRQVPVEKAEYRVAFVRGNGLWSTIGTQCLMVRGQPTCNLGDVNWADPRDLVRCVRHEITGHGTGALHAQSLESYSQIVDLDLPAILQYYMQSQGWSYQQAAAQFEKVASAEVEEGLQSRTSIMAYEIARRFDRRDVGVPLNWDWDATDKAQFRKSYPGADGLIPAPHPTTPTPDADAPILTWGRPLVLPFAPGGVARAVYRADQTTRAVVRVLEAASGSPLLDVIPTGGTAVRVQPQPGTDADGFLTSFAFTLVAPAVGELHVSFRGPAPHVLAIKADRVD